MGAHEQPSERAAPALGWVDVPPPAVVQAPQPVLLPPPGEFDQVAEAVPAAYLPARYPPEPVAFSTPPPRHPRPQWDQPRVQRLRGSQVTFGVVGRLVVTGLVVLFVLWMMNLGVFIFFLVPALPALVWLLKDNWRKAPDRRAPEPTHVGDAPRTAARDPFGPLAVDVAFDPHVRPPDATTTP